MLILHLHMMMLRGRKNPSPISFHSLFLPRRRKNLAVHLGLDDTVSKREVQKINTYRGVARGFRPTFPPPFIL